MRKANEEVQERGVRFEALAGGDLGEEIQILQAGEERRGSCACRRPTDVALIQPWWSLRMRSSTFRTPHPCFAGRVQQKVQGSSRSGANGRKRD